MKAIRITFKRNNDITSRIVSMFFRTTGIYVTDRLIYKEGVVNEKLDEKISLRCRNILYI